MLYAMLSSILCAIVLVSFLVLPAQARNLAKTNRLVWLGSYVTPTLRWEVKAVPGTGNPGPRTVKLEVAEPDGKTSQWSMSGEGNNWRLKTVDGYGGIAYGVIERGAYLPGSTNPKPSPYTFKYKIFVEGEQIAHGTYEWQCKYTYSKNQPQVDKFVLPAVQVDRTKTAGCSWVVTGPRIVFENLSCTSKYGAVPNFVALFEFRSPDGKVFKCTRRSEQASCEHVNFPDDFAPPFPGYKSGRYSYKTTVQNRRLSDDHFDCIDKSDPAKQVQSVTILTPGL